MRDAHAIHATATTPQGESGVVALLFSQLAEECVLRQVEPGDLSLPPHCGFSKHPNKTPEASEAFSVDLTVEAAQLLRFCNSVFGSQTQVGFDSLPDIQSAVLSEAVLLQLLEPTNAEAMLARYSRFLRLKVWMSDVVCVELCLVLITLAVEAGQLLHRGRLKRWCVVCVLIDECVSLHVKCMEKFLCLRACVLVHGSRGTVLWVSCVSCVCICVFLTPLSLRFSRCIQHSCSSRLWTLSWCGRATCFGQTCMPPIWRGWALEQVEWATSPWRHSKHHRKTAQRTSPLQQQDYADSRPALRHLRQV
jgi:hypothetical protein